VTLFNRQQQKGYIMRHARRSILAIGAGGIVAWPLLSRTGFAQSPPTTRIRGVITGVKENALAIRTNGGDVVTVGFGPQTPVVAVAAASLADIKPGSFVGSAARPGADGKLVALEVHIFPESLRGLGEGHRTMDSGTQTTMTNGTVGSDIADVSSVSGRSITIKYADGAKTVLVPEGVPVVTYEISDKTMLTPGAHVSVTASQAGDAALAAVRITVGKPGVTPPI
jgi:hypothetical protein